MVTQVTATYAEMCTWENLYAAYRAAARGKRSHPGHRRVRIPVGG